MRLLLSKSSWNSAGEWVFIRATFNCWLLSFLRWNIRSLPSKDQLPSFLWMEVKWSLEVEQNFKSRSVKTKLYWNDSLSFLGPKICELLSKNFKEIENRKDFKSEIKHLFPSACPCIACCPFVRGVGLLWRKKMCKCKIVNNSWFLLALCTARTSSTLNKVHTIHIFLYPTSAC